MAKTEEEKKEANRKAVKDFYANKCMEFKVRPRKEEGQEFKDYAQATGTSVQQLFLQAVREYMARHSGDNNVQETVEVSGECFVEISQEMYEKAQMSANYHKMSMREFVEMSIAEQRMRDLKGVQTSVAAGKRIVKGETK